MNIPQITAPRFSSIYPSPPKTTLEAIDLDSILRMYKNQAPEKFEKMTPAQLDEFKVAVSKNVADSEEFIGKETATTFIKDFQLPLDKLETLKNSATITFNTMKVGNNPVSLYPTQLESFLLTEDDAKALKEWLAARLKKA